MKVMRHDGIMTTGIVRKIDNVGRFVLPKELRDRLKIERDTEMQIYVSGSYIVIEKAGCLLCGSEDVIETAAGLFCRECRSKVARGI